MAQTAKADIIILIRSIPVANIIVNITSKIFIAFFSVSLLLFFNITINPKKLTFVIQKIFYARGLERLPGKK